MGAPDPNPRKGLSAETSLILIILVVIVILNVDKISYLQHISFFSKSKVEQKSTPSKASPDMKVEENLLSEPVIDDSPTANAPAVFKGGVLEIPVIGLRKNVMGSTSVADLKKGPGWYTQSALPGQGNTAIAGHRTTHGGPFRKVPSLKTGDTILLHYDGETFIYQVEKVFTVASNNWDIIKPCGYTALTLTTCHPSGSSKRIVVRADLIK